ncbi:MAG: 1,2-phenylacetyl-CoA epoxidase subunit PaaD [Phycisphaerales bacterium]
MQPLRDAVFDELRTIDDPEMPISIVDLGIVEDVAIDGSDVTVTILPTFVGCPALDMIRSDIESHLSALGGVDRVNVRFVHDPAWTPARISEQGRARLREHGVTTTPHSLGNAAAAIELRTSAIACPFCASNNTRLDSPFGPTRCRAIYYCDGCRNSFEHIKHLPNAV